MDLCVYRMVWGLFVLCSFALGHHHHLHQRAHRRHNDLEVRSNANVSNAESIVASALAALSGMNKARVENPSFNKYEITKDAQLTLADPLDYSTNTTNKTKRGIDVVPYTIPSELKDAARVVAESKVQKPSGDHTEVAAKIKAKYEHNLNNTNAPSPLDRPYGPLGTYGPESQQKVFERATGYWMVEMSQLGYAPYAPKGYNVWRNVKDFGAKGDGKTDDTAAINRAISDGNRCGPECGASTKVPAVIYFPPGTYLVSSPIIQYYNTQFLGDPHNIPTILAAREATQGSVGLWDSHIRVGGAAGSDLQYTNCPKLSGSVNPKYDWKVPFPVRTEVTATHYFTYDIGQPTKAA